MYDGISGQYYLRARFYNPKIGRFMQEDAYRGDGLNLYAYCQNNPITYYDPSGYLGLCPAGKSNTFEQEQYKNRINQTPSEDSSLGTWTGKRGESTFIPSDPKLREILQTQYGVDGVTYTNGVPDFSSFSVGTVEIFNMHGGPNGRNTNFSMAYEQLSLQTGKSVTELKEMVKTNKLTWHECNNMITMQLVPTRINSYFGHTGGVGEINFYFKYFGY